MSMSGDNQKRCGFCGRSVEAVTHLVRSRGAVYICDRCVAQAHEMLVKAAPTDKVLRFRPPSGRVGDHDQAEEAVELAFETMFDATVPVAQRCASIEDGANLESTMQELEERYAPSRDVEVVVDAVRFVADHEAEVRFTILLPQFGQGELHRVGYAVHDDGTWKVARQTWCELIGLAGVQCPPRSVD